MLQRTAEFSQGYSVRERFQVDFLSSDGIMCFLNMGFLVALGGEWIFKEELLGGNSV